MKNQELKVGMTVYQFDGNHRIYTKNGVAKSSPYYDEYFRPITILVETETEFRTKHGTITKRSLVYNCGRTKSAIYTEQQKTDMVYVEENAHLISEKVRRLSAEKLRLVEVIINN